MELEVLSFALQKLAALGIQEVKFLYGVADKVQRMQVELGEMQTILSDLSKVPRRNGESIHNCTLKIGEAIYDAENIIERHALRVERRRKRKGLGNTVKRHARIFRKCKELHKVGTKIDAIIGNISLIRANIATYSAITNIARGPEGSMNRQYWISYDHGSSTSAREEEVMVGAEEALKTLEQLLMEDETSVVSIWGMGGLGKTTLAKKVYNFLGVRRHFDRFAWVSISDHHQSHNYYFDPKAVLQDIVTQLNDSADNGEIMAINYDALCGRASQIQRDKKCLVILDDVWRTENWDLLQPAFPVPAAGSKLLLTTRIKAVADSPRGRFLYQPGTLSDEDSWELLRRKACRSNQDEDAGGRINNDMENEGKKMAKLCGGLPLAIVVLGGTLAKKLELPWWQDVYRRMVSRSDGVGDDRLAGGVLDLSFNDLPPYLRLCLMYMAHFPKGEEIPVNTLFPIWMAEGLIWEKEARFEDAGRDYLDELIGRSMVQVGSPNSYGSPKTCRLHDLVRDFALSKARDFFFQTLSSKQRRQTAVTIRNTTSNNNVSCKVRRSVLYLYHEDPPPPTHQQRQNHHEAGDDDDDDDDDDSPSAAAPGNLRSPGNFRSLLIFCPIDRRRKLPEKKKFNLRECKLLRVLHLERLVLGESSLKAIRHLLHLRYLSFKDSHLSCDMLPDLIGKLRLLQTLDLRFHDLVSGFKIRKLLSGVKKVRHLYLPEFIEYDSDGSKFSAPDQWRSLKRLETLKNFNAEHWDVGDLANLKLLRKLKLIGTLQSFGELEALLRRLRCTLQSLCLEHAGAEARDLEKLSNFQYLYKLKLSGKISSLPEPHCLPRSLTMLVLSYAQLEQDPTPILETLANLTVLHLLTQAYIGHGMAFSSNGFPRLKYFHLSSCSDLQNLSVEQGAMPCLKGLKIGNCRSLEMIPRVLLNIRTLHSLEIRYMPQPFKETLLNIQGGDVNRGLSITFFP